MQLIPALHNHQELHMHVHNRCITAGNLNGIMVGNACTVVGITCTGFSILEVSSSVFITA